jgi:hypothetical protein
MIQEGESQKSKRRAQDVNRKEDQPCKFPSLTINRGDVLMQPGFQPILQKPEIPPEIVASLDSWQWWSTFFLLCFFVLAVIGAVSSIILLSIDPEKRGKILKPLIVVNAVAWGLLAAFQVQVKGKEFKAATRVLTIELIKYRTEPTYNLTNVIAAWIETSKSVDRAVFDEKFESVKNTLMMPTTWTNIPSYQIGVTHPEGVNTNKQG